MSDSFFKNLIISLEAIQSSEEYTFTTGSKFLLISVAPMILAPLQLPFISIVGGPYEVPAAIVIGLYSDFGFILTYSTVSEVFSIMSNRIAAFLKSFLKL